MLHELKCDPDHFQAVWAGQKKAEIRRNDRFFRVGDTIILEEFEPIEARYSGRYIETRITHILDDRRYLALGMVMLSLKIIDRRKKEPSWAATTSARS
jgi:hypothetical protein